MAEPLRRIGVVTGRPHEAVQAALAELAAARHALGLELLLPRSEAERLTVEQRAGYLLAEEDELADADLCLVFGGDGTILRSLGRLLGTSVPTLGVNYGNVGFLASLPRSGWLDGFGSIVAGDYRVVELLTVEVQVNGDRFTAVNDVVLSRVAPRHVLRLQYEIAGVTAGTMSCDGLVISSPAGSSAYSLSCGGPIIEWDAAVLLLNFIAPHSLGFRPLILRTGHVITARNLSPEQEAEVAVDGVPKGYLAPGDSVRIAAGQLRARLLVQSESSFYRNVEEKLFDRRDAR